MTTLAQQLTISLARYREAVEVAHAVRHTSRADSAWQAVDAAMVATERLAALCGAEINFDACTRSAIVFLTRSGTVKVRIADDGTVTVDGGSKPETDTLHRLLMSE